MKWQLLVLLFGINLLSLNYVNASPLINDEVEMMVELGFWNKKTVKDNLRTYLHILNKMQSNSSPVYWQTGLNSLKARMDRQFTSLGSGLMSFFEGTFAYKFDEANRYLQVKDYKKFKSILDEAVIKLKKLQSSL